MNEPRQGYVGSCVDSHHHHVFCMDPKAAMLQPNMARPRRIARANCARGVAVQWNVTFVVTMMMTRSDHCLHDFFSCCNFRPGSLPSD